MIRASRDVLQAFERAHPAIREFVVAWQRHELSQLPFASPATFGVAQGRCQVLTELVKLVHGTNTPAQP